MHDDHIWTPLKETSAKLLYCSGKKGKDFKKFIATKNDLIFEGYFFDHFNEICNTVEAFLSDLPQS
jgi:hypothetical protein